MTTAFKKLHWTEHSKIKMRQYGLSKTKLTQLLRKPERKEWGIVPGTMAVMKTNKSYSKAKQKKNPGEVWLMYKDAKDMRKIISTWRYPGTSKPGEEIPIPKEICQELLENKEW